MFFPAATLHRRRQNQNRPNSNSNQRPNYNQRPNNNNNNNQQQQQQSKAAYDAFVQQAQQASYQSSNTSRAPHAPIPSAQAPFNPSAPYAPNFSGQGQAPYNPSTPYTHNSSGQAPYNPTAPYVPNSQGQAPYNPSVPHAPNAQGQGPYNPAAPAAPYPPNSQGQAPYNATTPYSPNLQGQAPYNPSAQYAPHSQGQVPYNPAAPAAPQGQAPYNPSAPYTPNQTAPPSQNPIAPPIYGQQNQQQASYDAFVQQAQQGSYQSSNPTSTPYVPNNSAAQPYNPSAAMNAAPGGNQPGNQQQAFQSSLAPPPLSDLGSWFDYYDGDRSRTLDKEEVVFALVQTTGATSTAEQQNIRQTVYNVFPAFDADGSGEIDKQEFCARNGLGESLQALMKQNQASYSSNAGASAASKPPTWECSVCTFQNYHGKVSCAMCGSHNSSNESSQQQQQQQYQLMRAPIPQGMQPGQQLQVCVGPSQSMMMVNIPDQHTWIMAPNGTFSFEFRVPINPAPAATVVTGAVVSPNQSYNNNNSSNFIGTPLHQRKQFQKFSNFEGRRYKEPPLRVEKVSIPPSMRLIQASGRRKALLIGINYTGTRAALAGCINDAKNIKRLLMQQGYPDDSSHMVMLTDEDHQSSNYLPTGKNIMKAMQWLLQGVSEGDVLFFHFSGHGAQVPDRTGQEADGLNETILPLDYKKKQITDDELWGTLVYPLPSGTRLTAIMDCCHSGTGLDLPFDYKLSSGGYSDGRWIEEINPAHSKGDVILFSGCEDAQTSADAAENFQAGGAMTQSFIKAFEKNPMSKFPEFLKNIHKNLKRRGFSQRPQLTSSQAFNVNQRIFSLVEGIEVNQNRKIGRIKRKHIRAGVGGGRRQSSSDMDMDDYLFGGAGIAGALLGMILR